MKNLFDGIPDKISSEIFQTILESDNVRIERIVSKGHTSPEQGWYDQEENEWVAVLQGHGVIEFKDGSPKELKPGDYLNIPAHTLHKVSWTDPNIETVWLAVFY